MGNDDNTFVKHFYSRFLRERLLIWSQSHGLSTAVDNYSGPLSHPHSLSHTHTRNRVLASPFNTKTEAKPKPSHAEDCNTPNLKLAYSPKRATAELRHSSSIGSRATPSPSASAVASSPLSPDYYSPTADDDDNGRDRYPRDRSFRSYFQPFLPQYLFPSDDLYRPHPHRSKISVLILVAVIFAAVISVSSVVKRLVCRCPFHVYVYWFMCNFTCFFDFSEVFSSFAFSLTHWDFKLIAYVCGFSVSSFGIFMILRSDIVVERLRALEWVNGIR